MPEGRVRAETYVVARAHTDLPAGVFLAGLCQAGSPDKCFQHFIGGEACRAAHPLHVFARVIHRRPQLNARRSPVASQQDRIRKIHCLITSRLQECDLHRPGACEASPCTYSTCRDRKSRVKAGHYSHSLNRGRMTQRKGRTFIQILKTIIAPNSLFQGNCKCKPLSLQKRLVAPASPSA